MLAIASPAFAADPATNQAAAAPAAQTATFEAMVAAGNLFEFQSSELALRRSHSGAVRDFANRMIADHIAAAAKFKQALADAQLTYIEAQYNAHVETAAPFKAYASGGENARMKAFAADVLPTLQGHPDRVAKLR
jgi:putative membrane protein